MRRSRFVLLCTAVLMGCGNESSSPSIAQAIDPATRKDEEKPEVVLPPKTEEPPALANPWTFDEIRGALPAGTTAVYARTGTSAKGKKVEDKVTYVVRSASEGNAGVSYTTEPDPGTNAASSQVANVNWSDLSPFFAMDQVEQTVAAREGVTVPAGTFEAVRVDLKDFFGNEKTVWMIDDKPGIYAKVIDRGNAGNEDDKTELVYELVEITHPGS